MNLEKTLELIESRINLHKGLWQVATFFWIQPHLQHFLNLISQSCTDITYKQNMLFLWNIPCISGIKKN